MKKFFAVVKREYVQRVRTKFFVVATVLGPLLMVGFTVVPALMFAIKSGGPTKLAIIDQTGQMYSRVAQELNDVGDESDENQGPPPPMQPKPGGPGASQEQVKQAGRMMKGGVLVEQAPLGSQSLESVKQNLEARVQSRELDGYIILPPNLLESGAAEYRARNAADPFTKNLIERAVTRAVRSQRLINAGIKEEAIARASQSVQLKTIEAGGKESHGEASFFLVFGLGLLIYMSVLLYGQLVLGAVIEEKETRIAEILFSSMRSFPLMMGKLIGVSLVALTQMAIWAAAFVAFSLWAAGGRIAVPHIPLMVFVYFGVYFLLGYFIYSTVYAVVGSMVTTTQEGGQVAMPVVLLLVAGFFLSFNIIRSPSSPLAFWASMFPFFAPITMLVRIVTETPPLWQILLSLGIGIATAIGLIWLASRIYRIGMLMTGKKATIPEVMRWIRQS